jgi:isopentenyl-diphosphate delta-isomerase
MIAKKHPYGDVVLVDEKDKVLGKREKLLAHRQGDLHRGYVVLLIDDKGVVLARRAEGKHCWPGFWDGTVASHSDATMKKDFAMFERDVKKRFLIEMEVQLTRVLPVVNFHYRAQCPRKGLMEHELCDFAIAQCDGVVKDPQNDEVSGVRHVPYEHFNDDFFYDFRTIAPWFLIAMALVRHNISASYEILKMVGIRKGVIQR